MVEHARLKKRAPATPTVRLGEGPERVRFHVGETFRVPPHKEADFALPARWAREN